MKQLLAEREIDGGEYESQSQRLEAMLKRFGIERWRVDLLMDRYVSNFSYAEIAKVRGYVDGDAVHHLLETTLKIMSKVGIPVAKRILRDYA